MNVVDSSAWLEYFGEGENAEFFSQPIEAVSKLIVPVISIYEVFKRICQQSGEGNALQAIALMQQGRVIEMTSPLALNAAKLSIEHRLPMADSLILATARMHNATLWTQDADFEGIAGVKFKAK